MGTWNRAASAPLQCMKLFRGSAKQRAKPLPIPSLRFINQKGYIHFFGILDFPPKSPSMSGEFMSTIMSSKLQVSNIAYLSQFQNQSALFVPKRTMLLA